MQRCLKEEPHPLFEVELSDLNFTVFHLTSPQEFLNLGGGDTDVQLFSNSSGVPNPPAQRLPFECGSKKVLPSQNTTKGKDEKWKDTRLEADTGNNP